LSGQRNAFGLFLGPFGALARLSKADPRAARRSLQGRCCYAISIARLECIFQRIQQSAKKFISRIGAFSTLLIFATESNK
jgi:hypothetical protein